MNGAVREREDIRTQLRFVFELKYTRTFAGLNACPRSWEGVVPNHPAYQTKRVKPPGGFTVRTNIMCSPEKVLNLRSRLVGNGASPLSLSRRLY